MAAGDITPGVRHDLGEFDYAALEMGEYGYSATDECWYCRCPMPGIGVGNLKSRAVVENADGTITVTPSILCNFGVEGRPVWHGYLTNGVWTEV